MSFENALSFLLIIFIFAITPGPGVFALIAKSLSSGTKACTSMAFGMAVSDVIYLILACLGLAAIAELWSELFLLIRFFGAFYLIYLGMRMWISSSETAPESNIDYSLYSNSRGFFQGFLISASNPKVIIFYIAILPTIIDLKVLTSIDIIVASALTICGLMSGLMLVAICASFVSSYLTSPKSAKTLNKTSGGIMIGAGAYLGLHG